MSEDNEILTLLDLETLDTDLFRGFNPPFETRRIYGGQVVAQALAAAYRTIEDRVCHSLHSYFIRPGNPKLPILFQVDRARDVAEAVTRAGLHQPWETCLAEESGRHRRLRGRHVASQRTAL